MEAQHSNNLPGEYYLRGIIETASGFKLNADSSFEFFFSYGALDRSGKGKWSVTDNGVMFKSAPFPGKEFKLINSKKTNDDRITIKITDPNTQLLSYVYVIAGSGEKLTEQFANKEGIVHFPKQRLDSLTLIFKFCPERESVFNIPAGDHNYFEFGFEPWLMDVFFDGLVLQKEEEGLKGQHPLLKPGEYHFVKNK